MDSLEAHVSKLESLHFIFPLFLQDTFDKITFTSQNARGATRAFVKIKSP